MRARCAARPCHPRTAGRVRGRGGCSPAPFVPPAEITQELFIAEQTAKTHVSRILGKLELRDRVQAVVYGYETGLVRPGGGAP